VRAKQGRRPSTIAQTARMGVPTRASLGQEAYEEARLNPPAVRDPDPWRLPRVKPRPPSPTARTDLREPVVPVTDVRFHQEGKAMDVDREWLGARLAEIEADRRKQRRQERARPAVMVGQPEPQRFRVPDRKASGRFAETHVAAIRRGAPPRTGSDAVRKAERAPVMAMPSQVRPVARPPKGRERQGAFDVPPRKVGVEAPPSENTPIAAAGSVTRKQPGVGEVETAPGVYPYRPRFVPSRGRSDLLPTPAEAIAERQMGIWDEVHVRIKGDG
jgi:hypothetical protein